MTTTISDIIYVNAGFGQHAYYLSLPRTITAIKHVILSETTYLLSLASSKISICLFLLSIIKTSSRDKMNQNFLHFTIGLLFITTITCVSQQVGQCRPASKLWDPAIPATFEDPRIQEKLSYFNGGQFPDPSFRVNLTKPHKSSLPGFAAYCLSNNRREEFATQSYEGRNV